MQRTCSSWRRRSQATARPSGAACVVKEQGRSREYVANPDDVQERERWSSRSSMASPTGAVTPGDWAPSRRGIPARCVYRLAGRRACPEQPAPPAAAPPSLTPPIVQGSTDVPYPKGAKGDAVVLLELTIEKDGTVSSAVVTEGVEPFAEQARQAVLGWRFTPALRGGNPVGARIRARVEFHQEEISGAPPSWATPPRCERNGSATLSASAQAPEPPEEVNVHGTRREIGQTTLSATDVREMPGAFGDPFRAIEALPGVVPLTSGLPYFYIRGAPPNDNGYYVDGIRVPLLFHVGIGEGSSTRRSSIMSTSIRAPRRPATEGSRARPSRVRRASPRPRGTVKPTSASSMRVRS